MDWIAMGHPLGPIQANIFMARLDFQIHTAIKNFLLYSRYVASIGWKNTEVAIFLFSKFFSFFPFKHNWVKTLHDRAKRICLDDTIVTDTQKLKQLFRNNASWAQFFRYCKKSQQNKYKLVNVEKCPVYISLPYGGDNVSDMHKTSYQTAYQWWSARQSFLLCKDSWYIH